MHDHGGRETPVCPPRPPRRRWRPRLAALIAMLAWALAVAACGGGGKANGVASLSGAGKATATTSAGGGKAGGVQVDRQKALPRASGKRQPRINLANPHLD